MYVYIYSVEKYVVRICKVCFFSGSFGAFSAFSELQELVSGTSVAHPSAPSAWPTYCSDGLFLVVSLLLVARPGATSSVLAPSSKARSP